MHSVLCIILQSWSYLEARLKQQHVSDLYFPLFVCFSSSSSGSSSSFVFPCYWYSCFFPVRLSLITDTAVLKEVQQSLSPASFSLCYPVCIPLFPFLFFLLLVCLRPPCLLSLFFSLSPLSTPPCLVSVNPKKNK